MITLQHYINGQRRESRSGRFNEVRNPATGQLSAQVALASADELNEAVAAAKAAFPAWSATTPLRRARVLSRFKELLEQNAERLATILSEEGADVLTVYDDHGAYGHPDHIQVHRVGVRAAALAGTPKVFQSTINRTALLELMKSAPPSE